MTGARSRNIRGAQVLGRPPSWPRVCAGESVAPSARRAADAASWRACYRYQLVTIKGWLRVDNVTRLRGHSDVQALQCRRVALRAVMARA